MVCNALVAGGRLLGIEQQAVSGMREVAHRPPAVWSRAAGYASRMREVARRPPATKALHTICGNNTSTVSSSWWWAYECPKHVEQIIIAIKHSVASIWFSSLRMDACMDKHTSNLKITSSRDLLRAWQKFQYAVLQRYFFLAQCEVSILRGLLSWIASSDWLFWASLQLHIWPKT